MNELKFYGMKTLESIKTLEKEIEDDLRSIEIYSECPSIADRDYWSMMRYKNRLTDLKKFLQNDFKKEQPLWKSEESVSSLQGVF